MTIKELNTVKTLLLKIRPQSPYVTEVRALIDRDIARLEQRSKQAKEENQNNYEYFHFGSR